MIEINLLPAQLRKKRKVIPNLPAKVFLILPSVVVGILIFLHLLFIGIILIEKNQISGLQQEWQALTDKKKEAEDIRSQLGLMEGKLGGIAQLSEGRIPWVVKLNKISDFLPQGLWLTRLSIDAKTLNLEGSAISLKSEEMSLISKCLQDLKADKDFFADFSDLELKSIQRRYIKDIEVVDFIIAGNLITGTK
ncbi:MAG: PilN domain-containing protein [Candidatus Omnitrophota bacterium]